MSINRFSSQNKDTIENIEYIRRYLNNYIKIIFKNWLLVKENVIFSKITFLHYLQSKVTKAALVYPMDFVAYTINKSLFALNVVSTNFSYKIFKTEYFYLYS